MTTLYAALQDANAYWQAKGPSSRMMPIRAQACATFLGPNAAKKLKVTELGPTEATKILAGLHRTKGKGSVPVYYAAFKRAVEMAGGDTRKWPKAGSAPRKCREPLSEADLDKLADQLQGYSGRYSKQGWSQGLPEQCRVLHEDETTWTVAAGGWETYDLLELLRGTGLRIEREALNGDALRWDPERKLLHITGKGSHERVIPVERPETVELLGSKERMAGMRRLGYTGHLKRWNAALERLSIQSLKPTPHAVRHYYATKVYQASGKDLALVRQLLGHADIGTTARYLGVDVEAGRAFVA